MTIALVCAVGSHSLSGTCIGQLKTLDTKNNAIPKKITCNFFKFFSKNISIGKENNSDIVNIGK